MKKQVEPLGLEQTQLTASAGIAPNKMLAKIASDLNKPNGQFEVKPHGVAAFMQSLPVRKICVVAQDGRELTLEDLTWIDSDEAAAGLRAAAE